MALSKPVCGRTVSAEFCLGDPDFYSCEMCGDKCPEYNGSLKLTFQRIHQSHGTFDKLVQGADFDGY